MREKVVGINWIWYHTDTKEDAINWFTELTGVKPYDFTIVEPVTRSPKGEHDHLYGFRIHI